MSRLAAGRSDLDPAWSPDGSRIAFVSTRDRNGQTCFETCAPNGEIYVMDADASQQRRVTRSPADDRAPAWSADGTRILFQSDRASARVPDVYVANPDGTCVTPLATEPGTDAAPATNLARDLEESGPLRC